MLPGEMGGGRGSSGKVGVELMGIDFAQAGYLTYYARAGMGEAEMAKIEILGESVERHVHRLHDKVDQQLKWMTGAEDRLRPDQQRGDAKFPSLREGRERRESHG